MFRPNDIITDVQRCSNSQKLTQAKSTKNTKRNVNKMSK